MSAIFLDVSVELKVRAGANFEKFDYKSFS